MMRIIRVFCITKKNSCIFQNHLQGHKALIHKPLKMNVSSDALKEKFNEENLVRAKKVNSYKEMDEYKVPLNPNENLNQSKNNFQLPAKFPSYDLYQNKETFLKVIMNMTPSSAVLLMKNICSSKARSLDILNALSEKLQSNPPTTLMECSAVLFCAAMLNFKDVGLIKKLGEQIIENKSQFISHKLPTNIMRSLGVLKYNDQELLEVLLGCILFYKPQIPEDLVTVLSALAVINADTPYIKSLIQLLSIYQEMDYSHPEVYLNYVWSCVILNELNVTHISRVLSQDFVNKILDSDKQKTILLKLQNIHGAASTLVKSYHGPFLKEKHLCLPSSTKSKRQFLEAVKNSLYYICPKDGFLNFNVDTQSGFLIDVKCNVNPQGEIIRLKQNDTCDKVGIILLDYHDFCLGNTKVTGINAFKNRVIEAKGYKILMIPYTEFSISARLSEKIDYLRKKLRSVAANSKN